MSKVIYELRRELRAKYAELGNWRLVAKEYGITKPMAYRIAVRGYEPKDAHIRAALGLPVLIQTPACPACGEVHVSKHCPTTRKPPTRWADMPVKQVLRALRERQEI
jgi:hypothetical protein